MGFLMSTMSSGYLLYSVTKRLLYNILQKMCTFSCALIKKRMKQSDSDKISVIIPTYNRAELLVGAVRSVLTQTLEPAEILVIDDGSTDDSEDRVAALVREGARCLRYLCQPHRGPAAARNFGLANCSFDMLAFLDSDDRWEPRKLELQARAMRSSPNTLVSHTRESWYRRGQFLNQKKRHRPPHGAIFEQCLPLCCVGMSTVMARRALFEQFGVFDETLICCEDYDFWLRVAVSQSFLLVEQPLTIKHGGRPDQVSVRYRQGMDRFRIQALAKQLVNPQMSTSQRLHLGHELVKKCRIYGRGCGKHDKPEEERHYLRLADWGAALAGLSGQEGV
ncbi:Glycosyl transferase family 2 [Desulfofustis glycolicus DSM 9705]|uniref:Glycosyl transferase family 2 n=2 Tax=Desulfofustis glycolicus TaxID=51195 RepID=A0A1M5WVT8_9BACT|nr:Glycosyl transferase family 2 [Desulfofustis glycolicus DSM 9705]